MRLAWIDVPFEEGKLRNMTAEKAKEVYNIGFRIVGVPNELDASDDDIKWAKSFLADNDLLPGPPGAGVAAIRPDKDEEKEHQRIIIQGVQYSGKLGAPSFRFSIGSMDPKNAWIHHPDNHTQKAMDLLVAAFKKLAPYAEDANCSLIPETTQWTIVNNVERMKEFVDRVDSPYVKFSFDMVNHMTAARVYDSGTFMKNAIDELGDRIGEIHCKDVAPDPENKILVSHLDETIIGTGVLDHAALMVASNQLEPWKLFSVEHLPVENRMPLIKKSYEHLDKVAKSIGHQWSDPKLTRDLWLKMQGKRT
jgi:sugar phosphate isomerase/epimerase